jgi:hypothetical protein
LIAWHRPLHRGSEKVGNMIVERIGEYRREIGQCRIGQMERVGHPPTWRKEEFFYAQAFIEVALPAILWLAAAIRGAWTTCKGAYITLDNWLWILQSSDQRNYELGWIIRGWFVITVSLLAALFVSQLMLKRTITRASNDTNRRLIEQ